MSESMLHVKSLELSGITPFDHVVMQELGNMVILEGVNGVGKTQILSMLIGTLQGKTSLPDRPLSEWLKDGYESGVVKIELADGVVVKYTVRLTITAADATVQVKEVFEDGKSKEVPGGALTFLKKIVNAIAFRPQAWRKKSDAEQVEEIFRFFPDLKAKLDENDNELVRVKAERAKSLNTSEVLRLDISRLRFTPGLPEKETDLATLLEKLKAANEHNKELDSMRTGVKTELECIAQIDKDVAALIAEKKRTEETMEKLRQQVEALDNGIKGGDIKKGIAERRKEVIEGQIIKFVPHPVEPIEKDIAGNSRTNVAIRDNAALKQKQKDLEASELLGQELYRKIETVKADRVKIMSSAQIPIDGLSIGDGCLLYPNSNMEMVRLSALSDGEFWPVACGLVAAFKPRVGIVIVDNYWDLDKTNFEALCAAAKKYGMQPWIHKTLREESDGGAGFLICGGGIVSAPNAAK
jgi:hypothetical protein